MILAEYARRIARLLSELEATAADGSALEMDGAAETVVETLLKTAARSRKIILVGNGGSAAIASHMAADLGQRAGLRAQVYTDVPSLTAISNDHAYTEAYARMVSQWADADDCLVAISSSGSSSNIHAAVAAARNASCGVITLSGFRADNRLRRLGDLNFYVASDVYGEVEVVHTAFGHFVTDLAAKRARVAHF